MSTGREGSERAPKTGAARGKRPATRRRRMSAEAARERILACAEALVLRAGPDALRLKDVAEALGITHQAILHHFGSREGLLGAVGQRAMAQLTDELIVALAAEGQGGVEPRKLIDRVFDTFGRSGHGRLMAWLALSGLSQPPDPPVESIRQIARVLHARRAEWSSVERDFEHTVFTVLLAGIAAFGDALMGDSMRRSAGLGDDPDAADRFRSWITGVVVAQLAD